MKIRLTIYWKLILGFGSLTLAFIVVYIFIFFSTQGSFKIANKNLNVYSPSEQTLNELNVLINDTKMLIKNWVFIEKHTDTKDKLRLKEIHETHFPLLNDTIDYFKQNWDQKNREEVDHILISIKDTLFPLHTLVMESLSSFENYEDPMVLFEITPMALEDGEIMMVTDEILEHIRDLQGEIKSLANNGNNQLVLSFGRSRLVIITSGLILILIAVISSIFTTRSIIVPIHSLKDILIRKSKGDFTDVKIKKTNDEIGEMSTALENMSMNVKKTVEEIKTGADILANSSKAINDSSRAISSGAGQQAASAEEVSASMEEMTSSISQNSENSQHTEKIAKKVSSDIQEIQNSVNETSEAMKNIAEKILVINDIAERIDLLAINAAIEAARAGEHGKGFAVVASEVRNLAESSQVAANEIDDVSKSSVAIADKSNNLLQGLIPDITNTVKLVQEITAASLEQDSGINQINQAIVQLSQVTQQNSAAAEELSTSSDELLHQGNKLLESISFFKTAEDDDSGDASTAELEDQIAKLQELLLNRKSINREKAASGSPRQETSSKSSKNKGIDIKMEDSNDAEYIKY